MQCFAGANFACEICTKKDHLPLECHEVWSYDDHNNVQSLERVIALCPSCHEAKHFGLALKSGRGDHAFAHLMTVNGWSEEQAHAHLSAATDNWMARSTKPWTQDLSWLDRQNLSV